MKEQIRIALQDVFNLRRERRRDTAVVLSHFAEAIVEHAKYDQAGRLKPALDLQEHLIEQRLQRGALEATPFSLRREGFPSCLGDYADEAAAGAVASASREKVEVVLMFAAGVMRLAIEYRQPDLFRKASGIVEVAYAHGIEHDAVERWIGDLVRSWIRIGLGFFHGRRTHGFDGERAAREMPVLCEAIGWVLRLTRYALDAARRRDAEAFHACLFEFDPQQHLRGRRCEAAADMPPELCEVCDLHTYAQIAVGGWCVLLAQRRACAETVEDVFQRVMGECGTVHDLLCAWESLGGGRTGDACIDARLGLRHFSADAPHHSEWVLGGLVALGLVCPRGRRHMGSGHATPPPPIRYDIKRIEATADALLKDEYIRTKLLGLDEVQGQAARDELIVLPRERECLRKREVLDRVIHAPLSAQRTEDMRRAIRDALSENRWFLDLIRQLSGSESSASACIYPAVRQEFAVSRDDFAAREHASPNLHEVLAKQIGAYEDIRLAAAVERVAAVDGSVHKAGRIARAVREAITRLREGGFRPSLILVPSLPHVQDPLIGAGHLGSGSVLGPHRMRPFEGVAVMEWPYPDSASIAVVDVGSFYGEPGLAGSAPALTLEVEDRFREQNLALLERAAKEDDPEKIANPQDVQVEAVLRLFVGAGVANPEAAVRIALDPKSLGYGLRRSDDVYHRPDCELLTDADDAEFALARRLPDDQAPRNPCPKCKPDE